MGTSTETQQYSSPSATFRNQRASENHNPRLYLASEDGGWYSPPLLEIVPIPFSRICPGRFLAESSVWIVLATLLTVFDIRPAKDEQGSDIIPPEEFNTGLTRYVLGTHCLLKPFIEHLATLSHLNAPFGRGRTSQRV